MVLTIRIGFHGYGKKFCAPVYGFICPLSPSVWVRILNIISFPRSMGMIYASLSYFSVFLLSLAFARVMGHFFNQSFDCPSDARNRSAAHLYLTSIWSYSPSYASCSVRNQIHYTKWTERTIINQIVSVCKCCITAFSFYHK